jgi:WD40-like Beta Propeller Repeat
MKQFLTALAVAFVALFVFAGCNDYGNTFQNNTGAQITTLSPSNITAGSGTFTLTVSGNGFVAQTYIAWNGMKLTTTDIDDVNGNVLEVTAQIPASLVATPGKATIITHNPFSGAGNNGLSNPINFIINPVAQPNPVPLLQSLSPNNATAGATMPLALTLMGSDFVTGTNGATVSWTVGSTATMLTATVVNSTQINATVPTNLLSSAGAAAVNVVNPPNTAGTPPAGGGGPGNALAFTVNAAPGASVAKAQAVAEETPAVSAEGRYVAYTAMQAHYAQIFFRDTCTEAVAPCQPHTALASIASDGSAANADSHSPSVSADGRYVAFSSAATNLLPTSAASSESAAQPGPGRQIYLRDTCTGTSSSCTPSTALISTDASGALSGTESILPSVSASGRFVAFVAVMRSKSASGAAAAQSGATNSGYRQIFVRDTCLGATSCTPKTSRISMQSGDGTENGPSAGIAPGPALSSNGKQLALTGGDTALRFTRSVAVDDLLFLAAVDERP